MMPNAFPYQIDPRGRTAIVADQKHIEEMMEVILFTQQRERPNRPTFGCGLNQVVFRPNSDELVVTAQSLIQSSLRQWLGHLIQVESVDLEHDGSVLSIIIGYSVLRSDESGIATFEREVRP